ANAGDGSFRLEKVLVGEYRTSVPPVGGHYVKEVRFEGREALNSPIELRDSGSIPTIEVVLSPNVAQMEGTVTDEKNQVVAGVQVVLVAGRHRHRRDPYKAGVTDQPGRFTMKDLAPGDYKLFAWQAMDNY